MSEPWQAVMIFVALATGLSFAPVLAAWALRVRAKAQSPDRTATYECGEEPDGGAWIRFHPRYYLVALVFVLFDVEAVFLFPWAVNIRVLGDVALWEMLAFIGVLMLGWVYAVRKGALKWP